MKPRPLTILLLLLAGAVVNVGVAWGMWCARSPVVALSGYHLPLTDTEAEGVVDRFGHPGFPAHDRYSYRVRWDSYTGTTVTDAADSTAGVWFAEEYRVGWPLRSLVCGQGSHDGDQRTSLMVTLWGDRPVPYGIAAADFALNTLLYASVLWFVLIGPFALRRWRCARRTRRGLCPACGYPVGESTVCTECEKAVSSRRSTAT